MTNPTSNYGFVLPTATDLVTDLPADFDVALQGVDTRLKALNPETTLGDIAYSSATANTNTRLPIGTTGQVLAVTGGVPAWSTISAGGMTLLSTTTLSGATTTISSISQSYKYLFFTCIGMSINAAAYVDFLINNAYNAVCQVISSRYSPTINFVSGGAWRIGTGTGVEQMRPTTTNNNFSGYIYNYTSTTRFKPVIVQGTVQDNSSDAPAPIIVSGHNNSNTAVTSIVFQAGSSTFTGGTVLLYGVN